MVFGFGGRSSSEEGVDERKRRREQESRLTKTKTVSLVLGELDLIWGFLFEVANFAWTK